MRYVIIGGGVAGTTAAGELRKLDPSSEITIVSQEQHALYSRVLLPHVIKGKVLRERVFLKKEAWYGEQEIEWLRGVSVTSLNTRNKFVALSNGREIEYDKLLIATGGEVRNVDYDLRGVSYFRSLDDMDHMVQLFAQMSEGARGGIYGGGFIACEYINLYAHFKIPTVLCHRGAHFWTRVLESQSGALIAKHLEDNGVELHAGAEIVSLTGDKELTGFVTTIGEHQVSMLGVGIGIESDFSWVREAGVEVGAGIKADALLQTNIEDVFTAGDVAEFHDPIVDRQLVIGNWMSAMSQGRIVAKTMAGEPTSFELVSSYATNALGLEMIFIGDVEKAFADKIHLIGSLESGGITQIHERAGRIVGGVCLGRNTDRSAITKGIQAKTAASEIVNTLSG